jgi:hypothetical protein
MDSSTRRIAAAATGLVLGIPAAVSAFPMLGLAGGVLATAAIALGGAAGFMMMVPETVPSAPAPRPVRPEVESGFNQVSEACLGIRRTDVASSILNCAQLLRSLSSEEQASSSEISFVVLNLESLLGIAEAWRKSETSLDLATSEDMLAQHTIGTVGDIVINTRLKLRLIASRQVKNLGVELAVTRRINEEDRKGMQP